MTAQRTPLIMGNWKLNCSSGFIKDFLPQLVPTVMQASNAEVAVFPPFIYLSEVIEQGQAHLGVGAQDVSIHTKGAYTSEIAADMLTDIGCQYVLCGHSECREYHHHSNELVAQKAAAALTAGLTTVVCIGESLEQRQTEKTEQVLTEQLKPVFEQLSMHNITADKLVIAYEPIWAIGTGMTASPEQVESVHTFIRELLTQWQPSIARGIRIVYGGSLKAESAPAIFAKSNVDGGLVGGASLKADEFKQIILAV